jgi:hypothetical protein
MTFLDTVLLNRNLGFQMKWMESFLEGGQLAGKIICPNQNCGTKLGNYDWAGVRCGCKEWVTPVRGHQLMAMVFPDLSFSRDFALIDLKSTRLCDALDSAR